MSPPPNEPLAGESVAEWSGSGWSGNEGESQEFFARCVLGVIWSGRVVRGRGFLAVGGAATASGIYRSLVGVVCKRGVDWDDGRLASESHACLRIFFPV